MSPKLKFKILPALASGLVFLSSGIIIANTETNPTQDTAPVNSPSFIAPVEKNITPKIEKRNETETKEIPYETVTVSDPSLKQGGTKVTAPGENGLRELVYEVTYTDGVETHRELISDTIAQPAKDRIISEGTYVAPATRPAPQTTPTSQCTNGTYVNSAGNTVCRPSQTNTGNATARCGDGTYSYSQSRKGTCSHHNGVAEWY